MFQNTAMRVSDRLTFNPPLVLANEQHRFLVAEQLRDVGIEPLEILLEPTARNTGPAITAACYYLSQFSSDSLALVLPTDQDLSDGDALKSAIAIAREFANLGRLVTFGVKPDYAATNYGYLHVDLNNQSLALDVQQFVEKPTEERATEFIATGQHYWNSGMFLFSTNQFLSGAKVHATEITKFAEEAVLNAQKGSDFTRLEAESFSSAPNVSVDYAIMEKSHNLSMVPLNTPWSDLGSWDSVWRHSPKDSEGNVTNGPIQLSNTKNSIVFSHRTKVAVDHVDDLAVVVNDDAVFVGRVSDSQNVSKVFAQLAASPIFSSVTESHTTTLRPWGAFTDLNLGEGFRVKKISVNPNQRLSLQRHQHRSEHWVVVRGVADVQIGETRLILVPNQSAFIPCCTLHRLENNGNETLELIEVQTGELLSEDDIVRLEDDYGRPLELAVQT